MIKIPYGYCHCGCGQKTKIIQKNHTKSGFVKGEPHKYLFNHHKRLKGIRSGSWKGGVRLYGNKGIKYRSIYGLDNSKEVKYKSEHIIVAEKALGRKISPPIIVHHVDGTGTNNSKTNLVICQNQAYHVLLHKRQRALKLCGHADWEFCWVCRKYGDPKYMRRSNAGSTEYGSKRYKYRHLSCYTKIHLSKPKIKTTCNP